MASLADCLELYKGKLLEKDFESLLAMADSGKHEAHVSAVEALKSRDRADIVKQVKEQADKEPKEAVEKTTPEKVKYGWAWVKDQQRPITEARLIKKGKKQGQYEIRVGKAGTKFVVPAKNIIEMPGEAKVEAEKESKAAETTYYVNDYVKFKNTGGQEFYGDITKVFENTIDIQADGATSSVEIPKERIISLEKGGRYRERAERDKIRNEAEKPSKKAEVIEKIRKVKKTEKTEAEAAEGAKPVIVMNQSVYHGTPHVWPPEPGFPHGRPRLDKIGTGEGATAYGWGWYGAEAEQIANWYFQSFSTTIPGAPTGRSRHMVKGQEIPPGRVGHLALDTGLDIDNLLSYIKYGSTELADIVKDQIENRIAKFKEYPHPGIAGEDMQALVVFYEKYVKTATVEDITEKPQGSLYKLDIPDDVMPKLLDWDKPVPVAMLNRIKLEAAKKWSNDLQNAFNLRMANNDIANGGRGFVGENVYRAIQNTLGSDHAASHFLADAGIPGNKYLDAMSRDKGEGSYNYVIWDQKVLDRIALLERNGEKLDAIREIQEQRDRLITQDGKQIVKTLADLNPRFKNTRVDTLLDGLSYQITLPNGESFRLDFGDELEASPDVLAKYGQTELKPGQKVYGRFITYSDGKKIVQLSKYATQNTYDHELQHFLESIKAFNPVELAIMNKRAVASNYKADSEGRAQAIADAMTKRDNAQGIQRIIDKIKDFIDAIVNKIGIRTFRGIHREFESGKLFEREVGKVTAGYGTKYAFGGKKEREENAQVRPYTARDILRGRGPVEILQKRLRKDFGEKGKDLEIERVKNLSENQQAVQKVAKTFNLKVIFVKAIKGFLPPNGVSLPEISDTVFINVDSKAPMLTVLGHETLHTLKNKHPELYDFLASSLADDVKNFDEYAKALAVSYQKQGVQRQIPIKTAIEEFFASFAGDQFTNTSFWDSMNQKNPTFTQKIIGIVKRLINRAMIVARLFKSETHFKDLKKAQDVLSDVMAEYQKREGGKPQDALINKGAEGVNQFAQDVKYNLGEAKKKITDNPAFRKWFGDSKVVDKNGEPLVVKHWTTSSDITIFKKSFLGEITSQNTNDKDAIKMARAGFWFTDKDISKETASDIAYPVYLSIKNPKIWKGDFWNLGKNIRKIKADGYDGIIIKDAEFRGTSFVVFDPTQIKSIFNRGTFEETNPNIMYSLGEPTSDADIESDMAKKAKTAKGGPVPESVKKDVDKADSLLEDPVDRAVLKHKWGMMVGLDKGLMSNIERTINTPLALARKHPFIAKLLGVQINRMDDKSRRDFHYNERARDTVYDLKGKDIHDFRNIVFTMDGSKVKGLPSQFIIKETEIGAKPEKGVGGVTEKDFQRNPEYIPALRKWLKTNLKPLGVSDKAIDAVIENRAILDDMAVDLDNAMVKHEVDYETITNFRGFFGKVHNYIPHQRWGNTVASIKDSKTDEVLYSEHFDRIAGVSSRGTDAQIKQQLVQWAHERGHTDITESDIKIESVKKLPDSVFFNIDIEAMNQILKAGMDKIENKELANLARHVFPLVVSDVLKSRGFGGHLIKRKGIPGFETQDVKSILYNYINGANGMMTKMEAAKDFSNVLNENDAKKDPIAHDYGKTYVRNMLSNETNTDRTVGMLKGLMFTKYLGGVVKSGVVNLTQNIVAMARLSIWHNPETGKAESYKGAGLELVKAMYNTRKMIIDYARRGKMLTNIKDQNEVKMLKELLADGLLRDHLLREIKGSIGTGKTKTLNKFIFVMGLPMQLAEQFNRASTALAGYRIAVKKLKGTHTGADLHNMAVNHARQVVNDAHFVYGKTNMPEILRASETGKIISSAYTFRTFTHQYAELMSWFIKQGGPGQLAAFKSMVGLFAVGGLLSLPLYDVWGEIYEKLFGEKPATAARRLVGNDFLKDIITFGIGGGLGVDLHGSLGIEIPKNLKDVIGVPWAFIEDANHMYQNFKYGDYVRAIEESPVTPMVVRNAMSGYRQYEKGVYTRTGTPVSDVVGGKETPRKMTGFSSLKKAILGFQPIETTKAFEAYSQVAGKIENVNEVRRELATKIVNAKRDGDTEKVNQIRKFVKDWNKTAVKDKKYHMVMDLDRMVKSRQKSKVLPKRWRGYAKGVQQAWQ